MLKRIEKNQKLYYYRDGVKIAITKDNIPSFITGDISGIRGDVSSIFGNVLGIFGNVSSISGDVSKARAEYFNKLKVKDNYRRLDIKDLVSE